MLLAGFIQVSNVKLPLAGIIRPPALLAYWVPVIANAVSNVLGVDDTEVEASPEPTLFFAETL